MIIEIENKFILEEQMVKLLKLPRQREWELFMNKFQKPLENPDNPGKWQKMEQIFKLSECI
jgi:L-rhamnose mutarotase